jgi:hypothetical protein
MEFFGLEQVEEPRFAGSEIAFDKKDVIEQIEIYALTNRKSSSALTEDLGLVPTSAI